MIRSTTRLAAQGQLKTVMTCRIVFPSVAFALLHLLTGCATLPENVQRPVTHAFEQQQTRLSSMFATRYARHPGQSGFILMDTGRQAFTERAALIDAADHTIDAQYYIWNHDRSGMYMLGRLLLAAERGVRVRILLDDINIDGSDNTLMLLSKHPNIHVRIFNPLPGRSGLSKWLSFLGDFSRLNQRMHNKSFIVDGQVAIMGGRNIGDEYFDMNDELNFRDRGLLALGAIVKQISYSFDAYWNNKNAYPVASLGNKTFDQAEIDNAYGKLHDAAAIINIPDYQVLPGRPAIDEHLRKQFQAATWAGSELVYDEPVLIGDTGQGEQLKRVAQTLLELYQQAEHEVMIESAYLVMSDIAIDQTKNLTAKGVSIRALTNSLAANDLTTNHSAYARTRPDMLGVGIELYELRPDAESCYELIGKSEYCEGSAVFSLHSKSAVFDREQLYVGSYNINLRSAYLNFENALIINSPELANKVTSDIEENMKPGNSWQVLPNDKEGGLVWKAGSGEQDQQYSHEPETSFWKRFKSGFFSLFPLEKYF